MTGGAGGSGAPPKIQHTPNLQDTAKPKGFPTTGSKRLQPIKATALKNMDMLASPSQDSQIDVKKNENMMRMTQPSSTDSAANLATNGEDNQNQLGYHSMTNFGAQR